MEIRYLAIRNFKSIRSLIISDVENALIVVGKNSTGKTAILDAVLAVAGIYSISPNDFHDLDGNIEIEISLNITTKDLKMLNQNGQISNYKRFDLWLKDFYSKLPSFHEEILHFTFVANRNGKIRYSDGFKKNNHYIPHIFPKIHYIDQNRNLLEIQKDILELQIGDAISGLRKNLCLFDKSKHCNNCFNCIGMIQKKSPASLTVFETAKLLEYKLFHLNIDSFVTTLNENFEKNSNGAFRLAYEIDFDIDEVFRINMLTYNKNNNFTVPVQNMSEGTKSIYILSLLETYIEKSQLLPSIIMMEDPEIYLHPQLQKAASEILYRLSKKNQVIFSTHSPNMIFNFNSKQIKQITLDQDYLTIINEHPDIDHVLSDLGYSANDLINVDFVFIVEGKQDSNRLPLLLNKYYSEIQSSDGSLHRIAMIPTNSCTNIKAYANLKFINKFYLKDRFLMIRDSDGKDPQLLTEQLCSYYKNRELADKGNLPRVLPRNVLILKYYSFENYFLDPKVMVKIGLLETEEEFFDILYQKYTDYLYRLTSTKKMLEITGIQINSKEDLKKHFETIKIYVRGHNLFDIFYGPFKGEKEKEILTTYINSAPRDTFKDILDAIDSFVYFESRKKELPSEPDNF
ncbi:ATP-dependent nuclease [Anaerosacchariphilus polymeriproducens]|uniref:OLD family endonuclease n=1 Tax=Anaerosacchariphilus polymeriproducens TaxID=1812858 RepID=A0A371ASN4_9FIRM|nr:ATP-binding protein [Anaerosacchariphilus polymeriproducens]RDU22584.1 OLD family endonuclease [Anaerosacchariphilus polymeriproducens]